MERRNLDGGLLEPCSQTPSLLQTGFLRDGYCMPHAQDAGSHTVCAVVTEPFLKFTAEQGNELRISSGTFPGLRAGDHWCLCAARYLEAFRRGVAPPILRQATHASFKDVLDANGKL